MLAQTFCASTFGVDAHIIHVEININGGVPKYFLAGLPDRAVQESRTRIEAAIKNSNASFPIGRTTVNLAPADIPKEGNAFDLPIALGLMAASGQIYQNKLEDTIILGELALDGKIRPVKGVLPIAVAAARQGFKHLLLPEANAMEAAAVESIQVLAVDHLSKAAAWLNSEIHLDPLHIDTQTLFENNDESVLDFSDVKGQESVKRSLEVAAAGSHNVILVGPPGSGKTMMARRIAGILPPMTLDEALETTKIHSVSSLLSESNGLITQRPFRSPHHTVSDVALVGGGSNPMPGEISLAHNGILFLDELPEFARSALEVMRQPLEDGMVQIARARRSVSYPSKIMLVASMNPSPSGDWFDPREANSAGILAMQRYLSKISGPLLDRIDLHVEVNKVSFEELSSKREGESSKKIRERVVKARLIQRERFKETKGVYANAQMSTRMVRKLCELNESSSALLKRAINKLNLSARAYDRILKVTRTIADLDESKSIETPHIAEAIQYRNLDRSGWLG